MTVYPWDSLVPVLGSPLTSPTPDNAQDQIQQAEDEDDDVFEPSPISTDPPTSSTSAIPAKRRSHSLSSLQNSKEQPQSPLKVFYHIFLYSVIFVPYYSVCDSIDVNKLMLVFIFTFYCINQF